MIAIFEKHRKKIAQQRIMFMEQFCSQSPQIISIKIIRLYLSLLAICAMKMLRCEGTLKASRYIENTCTHECSERARALIQHGQFQQYVQSPND